MLEQHRKVALAERCDQGCRATEVVGTERCLEAAERAVHRCKTAQQHEGVLRRVKALAQCWRAQHARLEAFAQRVTLYGEDAVLERLDLPAQFVRAAKHALDGRLLCLDDPHDLCLSFGDELADTHERCRHSGRVAYVHRCSERGRNEGAQLGLRRSIHRRKRERAVMSVPSQLRT